MLKPRGAVIGQWAVKSRKPTLALSFLKDVMAFDRHESTHYRSHSSKQDTVNDDGNATFSDPQTQERQMPQNRVSGLLAAYFTQPYVEYGDVAVEIRNNGGLTSEEVRFIENQVLHIDAATIIRHTGVSDE